MEQAAAAARIQKDQDASRKRQLISDEITNSSKRRRIGSVVDSAAVFSGVGGARVDSSLAKFDVTNLPIHVVVDLIVSSFQVLAPDTLRKAIDVRSIAVPLLIKVFRTNLRLTFFAGRLDSITT